MRFLQTGKDRLHWLVRASCAGKPTKNLVLKEYSKAEAEKSARIILGPNYHIIEVKKMSV